MAHIIIYIRENRVKKPMTSPSGHSLVLVEMTLPRQILLARTVEIGKVRVT